MVRGLALAAAVSMLAPGCFSPDNYPRANPLDPESTLDADSDGVPNNEDSCPTDANADQADLDLDSIGDACDGCVDVDGDGYGVGDSCTGPDCNDAAAAAFTEVCGDGVLCGEEACDDGYTDACGTCNADCTGPGSGSLCGDDEVCPELEPCDDGAATISCDADCTVPECGDGEHNAAAGEACDDGNVDDCSGDCLGDCSASVVLTGCGDGVTCGGEACDDIGESASCDDDCTLSECGDGSLNVTTGEVCDDGNVDSCLGDCLGDCSEIVTLSGCGDGATCDAEACDDGNLADGDYCSADCSLITGSCGDGAIIAALEDCDDDNTSTGDGCDDQCQREDDDLVCEGEPSLCTYPVTRSLVSTNGRTVCSVPAAGGAISCWGDNSEGIAAPPTDTTFREVMVGDYGAACGLHDDGQVECWGDDSYPTPPSTFVQMAQSGSTWCGLTDAGEIACWGPNTVTPPAGPFSRMTFLEDERNICVVRASGGGKCVSEYDGEVPVAPSGQFVDVAAGRVLAGDDEEHSVACWLGAGGKLSCDAAYGENPPFPSDRYRQLIIEPVDHRGRLCGILDDGSTDCFAQLPAAEVPGGPWQALSAARSEDIGLGFRPVVCGRSDADETRCWGPASSHLAVAPAELVADDIVVQGGARLCTLDGDSLRCLGAGANAPSGSGFADVSLGYNAGCALRTDGTLACWGDNTYQLATAPSGTFLDVAVSNEHACAIRDDGSLHCWGDNSSGQLDAPSTGEFVEVKAVSNQTCAMDMSDALTCWGQYSGTISTAWKAWTLTQDQRVCALLESTGGLRCWQDLSQTPSTPVPGAFEAVALLYNYDGCALKADKTMECWGSSITAPAGSYTTLVRSYGALCAVEDGTRQVRCFGQLLR